MFPPLQMGCKGYADRRVQSQAGTALEGSVSPLCLLSLVEFLLYRGKADLTVLDENKNTALHLACSKVPPAVQVGLCEGLGLERGPGGSQDCPDCLTGGVAFCPPAAPSAPIVILPPHKSSLSVPLSPSGPREMCPRDPGRNPRPRPHQCHQQCAADVSALGRGSWRGAGPGERLRKLRPVFQGPSGTHSVRSAAWRLWLRAEGQLAIAPTSCSFFFLYSKAPTHCRPEWSSFCGAGPAESWGHSAGCG